MFNEDFKIKLLLNIETNTYNETTYELGGIELENDEGGSIWNDTTITLTNKDIYNLIETIKEQQHQIDKMNKKLTNLQEFITQMEHSFHLSSEDSNDSNDNNDSDD